MKGNKPQKAKQGMGLHQFIAAGGKPSEYEGCKGVSSETVNNINRKDSKKK